MGLDTNGTRALLYARKQGVDFSRTAMLGRQSLHLNVATLTRNLKDFGFATSAKESVRLLTAEKGYAEPFLRLLGAAEIVSFDVSDFEGATHIHDFNLPLDNKFSRRFTVVLDSGSLEHIFNFPQAISNCMEMVDVGGHFIGITPTNNFLGHGFYQFSPELFFRVFSPPNGFASPQILAFESPSTAWYEVVDPDALGDRVSLINRRETYLLVIAQKTAEVPLFAGGVQQSFYSAQWQVGRPVGHWLTRSIAGWRSRVPAPMVLAVQAVRRWLPPRTGFDKRYFRKVTIP
jgi:hypothetical protein